MTREVNFSDYCSITKLLYCGNSIHNKVFLHHMKVDNEIYYLIAILTRVGNQGVMQSYISQVLSTQLSIYFGTHYIVPTLKSLINEYLLKYPLKTKNTTQPPCSFIRDFRVSMYMYTTYTFIWSSHFPVLQCSHQNFRRKK